MTVLKSSPPDELNAPGTFSHMMYLGYLPSVFSLISLMTLIISKKSPDLAPSSPVRFPAIETSWQGEPPVMISTGSISPPLISWMSPRCLSHGILLVVTRTGYGSTSLAHTGLIPAMRDASSKPPDPEKRLPIVSSFPSIRVLV